MGKLGLVIFAAAIAGMAFAGSIALAAGNADTLRQVNPPADPYTWSDTATQNSEHLFTEFIYDDAGVIMYEVQDPDGQILESRTATAAELARYESNRFRLIRLAARADLETGPPAGWVTWVANRVAELEACESDAAGIIAVDFNSLGPNTQDDVIQALATCAELNARVNRITIENLLDIAEIEGWGLE